MVDCKNFGKDDIDRCVKNLVAKIHGESTGRQSIWQQIPYWAANADGRTCYSKRLPLAYRQGYWPLEASLKNGAYTVYVDLETGRLVDANNPQNWASDEDVICLAFHLDQLDAQKIVSQLKQRSSMTITKEVNTPERIEWLRSVIFLELKPNQYQRPSGQVLITGV